MVASAPPEVRKPCPIHGPFGATESEAPGGEVSSIVDATRKIGVCPIHGGTDAAPPPPLPASGVCPSHPYKRPENCSCPAARFCPIHGVKWQEHRKPDGCVCSTGTLAGITNPYKHAYPDVFEPSSPHPLYHLHPLFQGEGVLRGPPPYNRVVEWTKLQGKSVALFFGLHRNNHVRNLLPHLLNYYRTINESGNHQKIEIIYVSLDESEECFQYMRGLMPWLSVPVSHHLTHDLKAHYRVFLSPELPKFGELRMKGTQRSAHLSASFSTGNGPRTDPPALLVIGGDGRLLQSVRTDHVERGLSLWDQTHLFF